MQRQDIEYRTIQLPKWDFETVLVVVGKLVFLPITPYCTRLGVQEYRQILKLKNDPDYLPFMDEFPVPSVKGLRKTWCLQRKAFAGWLNSITPNKVRPAFRPGLSEFRRDAMDAMDRALFGEVVDQITTPQQEVMVIEQGMLAHGQYFESRLSLVEEDIAKLKAAVADIDDDEIEVGIGQVKCPCGCGHIFSVRILAGDE